MASAGLLHTSTCCTFLHTSTYTISCFFNLRRRMTISTKTGPDLRDRSDRKENADKFSRLCFLEKLTQFKICYKFDWPIHCLTLSYRASDSESTCTWFKRSNNQVVGGITIQIATKSANNVRKCRRQSHLEMIACTQHNLHSKICDYVLRWKKKIQQHISRGRVGFGSTYIDRKTNKSL